MMRSSAVWRSWLCFHNFRPMTLRPCLSAGLPFIGCFLFLSLAHTRAFILFNSEMSPFIPVRRRRPCFLHTFRLASFFRTKCVLFVPADGSWIFTVCGALRLARFNVQKGSVDPSYFVGLPIPAAAFLVAATIFFSPDLYARPEGSQPFLVMMYALSFLMVSTIKYFSFKNLNFLHKKSLNSLVAVILVSVVVAAKPHIMLWFFMFSYVISADLWAL